VVETVTFINGVVETVKCERNVVETVTFDNGEEETVRCERNVVETVIFDSSRVKGNGRSTVIHAPMGFKTANMV
jgi:hypothetical protein